MGQTTKQKQKLRPLKNTSKICIQIFSRLVFQINYIFIKTLIFELLLRVPDRVQTFIVF